MRKAIFLTFLLPVIAFGAGTNTFWNVNVTSNLIVRTIKFSDGTTMTTAATGGGTADPVVETTDTTGTDPVTVTND